MVRTARVRPRAPARAGSALVDLLAALLIAALVGATLAALLRAQLRLGTRVNARAAAAEVERTAAVVLLGELRGMDPGRDIRGASADSLGIRAFRGVGVACAVGAGSVLVRYRGSRAPDLSKDSVLLLRAGSEVAWSPGAVGKGVHACASAEEEVFRFTPPGPVQPGDLLMVFETGSYHLADGALRYRRGQGGRQPLTRELLGAASGFGAPAAGPADLLAPGVPEALTAHLDVLLPGTGTRVPLDLRMALPNGGVS